MLLALRQKAPVAALLCVLLTGCATPPAAAPSSGAAEASPVVTPSVTSSAVYIAPEAIAPDLLSPPPVKGSAAWQHDLEQVIAVQQKASAADKVAADREQALKVTMLTEVLGVSFTADKLPRTFALLAKVGETCHETTEAAKNYWHTERPWLVDKRVVSGVTFMPSRNGAYPSGHTSCSRLWAEVLGQIVPAGRPALRARANSIAQHRMVSGMHFPHDLNGGEQVALLLFGALQVTPAYQADLAAARAEVQVVMAAAAPIPAPAGME